MNQLEETNLTTSYQKNPHRWAIRGHALYTGIQRGADGSLHYRKHNRVVALCSPTLTELIGAFSAPTDLAVHEWGTSVANSLTLALVWDCRWTMTVLAVYADADLSVSDVNTVFGDLCRGVKVLVGRNGWFANPEYATQTLTAAGDYNCPDTGFSLRKN